MKQFFLCLGLGTLLVSGGLVSCKGKDKQKVETETNYPAQETTSNPPVNAPVEISADDSLRQKLPEITKDFPGVDATVNNGEITVTGTLERARWMKLRPALDALHPRKVNNQLTLK